MTRKRNNELPPQFARARRRHAEPQPEEVAQPKQQAEKKKGWFSFGFGKKKNVDKKPVEKAAETPKVEEKKPVEKPKKKPTSTKKQVTKKSSNKKTTKKHKGVIAQMAEEDVKQTPKKKKIETAKKPKKTSTKKAAVAAPQATKKKQKVEFEQIEVRMDDAKQKRSSKPKTPSRIIQQDFVPQLVGDGSNQREEHRSILGIFGSNKAKKEQKALKVNLEFLSPVASAEDVVEEQPQETKKRSWFSFGFGKKKKAPAASEPEPTKQTGKRGAIASLSARIEDDEETLDEVTEEVEEVELEDAKETRAQKKQRLKEEKALLKERKKEEKESAKERAKEVKLLRKKQKEMVDDMEEEDDPEETKIKMAEVDQRIAEKAAEELERKSHEEERERRSKQANVDLDAMAMRLSKKKKKKGGGIAGILKSINNLGMGKYRAQFIQNLAMMLNAGLPLVDALRTLQLEMKSKPMRKAIARISELVDSGHPLWRAMEEQYLFSPYEVALIRVGEDAGNLARNAQYLAEQQEKDHALKQKVKMAMIYPSIVFVLMFIVIMGLGLFVLPNLVQVLYSLNADLPATTRGVIWITEMFSTYGKQGVPALLGGMVVLFLLAKYTALRVVSQWMVFKIPGIGRLAKEATIARFGVILGGLLEAGVPLVESIQSLEDVTHIVSYKKMYGKMAERVALGDSFSICFRDIRGSKKLIPPSMQQLIVTGERSGTLSETFKKVASIYEKKAEETAEKLPTILEPMLLLIIGGLVGTIAFAIITPIYSVVGNVGR